MALWTRGWRFSGIEISLSFSHEISSIKLSEQRILIGPKGLSNIPEYFVMDCSFLDLGGVLCFGDPPIWSKPDRLIICRCDSSFPKKDMHSASDNKAVMSGHG